MIHTQDADFTLLCGDVLDELATLPDESVHCVVTSPPYWGLRDYGTGLWDGGDPDCDHLGAPFRTKSKLNENWGAGYSDVKNTEDREPMGQLCSKCGAKRQDKQLGLEPTPDQYVARMVEVFREVRRVLRTDGTCWVNLGDSYNAYNGGAGPGSKLSKIQSDNRPALESGYGLRFKGLKPKDLVGIPWRVAFALQADGWYLRADIIWAKPNPMPESVTDRPTKSHEYVFLLAKSARYFFDQEAVREAKAFSSIARYNSPRFGANNKGADTNSGYAVSGGNYTDREREQTARNVRSVWEIATQPYPEAHFATYPEELVRRCVLAGTSERGCCPVCGKPWERETDRESYITRPTTGRPTQKHKTGDQGANGLERVGGHVAVSVTTLGWRPGCDCSRPTIPEVITDLLPPIPCTVLDPFLGSGTTAYVARKHGRRSIGIELNPAYAELAAKRMAQQSLFALEGTP